MVDYAKINSNYEQPAVNIEANDAIVEKIWPYLSGTYGPRVIDIHDGFSGLFRLDYDEKLFKKKFRSPVLVARTKGAGSKLQSACELKRFDTIGIDLVANSVNDMLVLGAEPLFFLDYVSVQKLVPDMITQIVKGIAAGCTQADCALIGGSTTEIPESCKEGNPDLAGFAVGVVERDKIITRELVHPGDIILGLASGGLHNGGYDTAVKIFKELKLKLTDKIDELEGKTIADVLLEPTVIYVRVITKLLRNYKVKRIIHAMAHITDRGLAGGIRRILPNNCDAVIKKSCWPRPPVFDFLQSKGHVEEQEMFRIFNMGIGYAAIVAPDFADSAAKKLMQYGQKVYKIGKVISGTGSFVLK
jgi:phosphoribosylformylglycinamidine cyclo-ligase